MLRWIGFVGWFLGFCEGLRLGISPTGESERVDDGVKDGVNVGLTFLGKVELPTGALVNETGAKGTGGEGFAELVLSGDAVLGLLGAGDGICVVLVNAKLDGIVGVPLGAPLGTPLGATLGANVSTCPVVGTTLGANVSACNVVGTGDAD